MTQVPCELRVSSVTPGNMSLIKNHNIIEDMKEPLWINSNVRLIRTFINFPVFPQSNTQVGNSLESRRPDCEHVALRSV